MRKIDKQQHSHFIYLENFMFLRSFDFYDNEHADYRLTNNLFEATSIDELSEEIR
ncbi:unnamed protein product [Fructobacillus tropaeoli]|uniref:hypothetical protein n=1 Tax=Fructobacillus tropaeoli TaxID=709323 RepID=UPI002D8F1342|nr:unnamed protein product [Fructobacillus tropaeoli]